MRNLAIEINEEKRKNYILWEFLHLYYCDIFGTKNYSENNLSASDYYVVFARLDF